MSPRPRARREYRSRSSGQPLINFNLDVPTSQGDLYQPSYNTNNGLDAYTQPANPIYGPPFIPSGRYGQGGFTQGDYPPSLPPINPNNKTNTLPPLASKELLTFADPNSGYPQFQAPPPPVSVMRSDPQAYRTEPRGFGDADPKYHGSDTDMRARREAEYKERHANTGKPSYKVERTTQEKLQQEHEALEWVYNTAPGPERDNSIVTHRMNIQRYEIQLKKERR